MKVNSLYDGRFDLNVKQYNTHHEKNVRLKCQSETILQNGLQRIVHIFIRMKETQNDRSTVWSMCN